MFTEKWKIIELGAGRIGVDSKKTRSIPKAGVRHCRFNGKLKVDLIRSCTGDKMGWYLSWQEWASVVCFGLCGGSIGSFGWCKSGRR